MPTKGEKTAMEAFINIMTLAKLPQDTVAYLQSVYARMQKDGELMQMLYQARELVWAHEETASIRNRIAQRAKVHPYTMDLILLILCFDQLRQVYREKGYSEELFVETVSDLRYKLEECRQVYGIHGNFVFFWYPGYFDCTRFQLGRLQFEPHEMKNDYKDILKAGDVILRCHIPMAGPLTPEAVQDSLERAYRFFGIKGKLYVHCASWLLYPGHYALYPEGSNLRKFYDLFDVYSQKLTPDSGNSWRVFGTMEKRPEYLPEDTSLRRAFKRYFMDGNCMGSGSGILIYEKEEIR